MEEGMERNLAMPRDTAVMTARLLGFGGLLPFIVLAAASIMGLRTPFAPAPALLIGYGAIIRSFVGALHWGAQLATKNPSARYFGWSVVPALMGWAALMAPAMMAAMIIIIGLVICLLVDRAAIKRGLWPDYMASLRLILTIVAAASMAVIFIADL